MKILIVEDEPKTGDYLRQGLSEAGFVTELSTDGQDGLHLALTGDFDLVILDVMLPGLNGWQVMERIRQAGRQLPVLFLTARDQVEDRVKGLELGADDYLVKPFAFSELLARVRTLLRRGKSQLEPSVLRVADLELDLLRRRVVRGGDRIELTAKEFDLLDYLITHPKQVLTRDRILEEVWGYDFMGDSNIIEVYIRYLRLKLEAEGEGRLIQTVRGVGYVLRD